MLKNQLVKTKHLSAIITATFWRHRWKKSLQASDQPVVKKKKKKSEASAQFETKLRCYLRKSSLSPVLASIKPKNKQLLQRALGDEQKLSLGVSNMTFSSSHQAALDEFVSMIILTLIYIHSPVYGS